MNFFMALIVAISAWMTFSVLNELALAKDGKGCCRTKNCGKGRLASSLWWINLVVAVVFTVYILTKLYDNYGGVVKSAFVRRNPVRRGVEMVFGN